MFGSSLPPVVCRRAHVLFTLFVFVCALRCPRHIVDIDYMTGADLGFQGGAHLKKLRRAEEGTNILGVLRVKNHYFTPKNHSFYNYEGRRENFWGISCEKSRFYAKKTFFSNFRGGGGRAPGAPPLEPSLYV